MATGLQKRFFPSQEIFDTFSMREQEQLSLLVGSNLVFLIMFGLFGIALFLVNSVLIGIGALCLLLFFALALYFIKKGHIHRGAWTTTITITIVSAIICFGAPYQQSNFLPYRDSCFIAVMSVCNYLISLRRRQLHAFFGFIGIIWVLANLIMYRPLYVEDFQAAAANIVICTLGIITANIGILLYDRFTRRVVERAVENENKSVAAFRKISSLIAETKQGLNIGKQLSSSTEKASENVDEIDSLYKFINEETVSLSHEAVTVKDSSMQINDKADKMKLSIQNQNNSIAETSKSLGEMSQNLTEISNKASVQHKGMDEIVHNLDSQMSLMKKLVDDVNQVKVSSDKVSTFVAAVNKIASQTGLLAMNASIEAAHAGVLGKGFSVIAQEIRKLSEETTKNAQNITDTLQENEEIVNATTESVAGFSAHTKATTEQLRNTIKIMEEILSGISGVDASTRDVMKSINQIVNDSQMNTKLAEGVADEIIQQNAALKNISNGTEQLQQKVDNLEGLLLNIRDAIKEIDFHASENETVAEKISGVLG